MLNCEHMQYNAFCHKRTASDSYSTWIVW